MPKATGPGRPTTPPPPPRRPNFSAVDTLTRGVPKAKPKPAPEPAKPKPRSVVYTKPTAPAPVARKPVMSDTPALDTLGVQHRPVPPAPPQPPHPVLLKHGIANSTQEFVDRVDATVKSYQSKYGYAPTPGLVYDVARSPLTKDQIPHLFERVAPSAKLQGPLAYRKDAEADRIGDNGHGAATFQTPFMVRVSEYVSEHPQTWGEALASHPTTQQGMLPVQQMFTIGKTHEILDDLNKEGKLVLDSSGVYKYKNPFIEQVGGMKALRQRVSLGDPKAQSTLAELQRTRLDIKTVQSAQRDLIKLFGDEHGSLRANGFFDETWLKSLVRFSHTTKWYEESGRIQAKLMGFDTYDHVLTAFKNKQRAVNQNPLFGHFLNALPLPLFHSGSSLGAMLDGTKDYIEGNPKHLLGPDSVLALGRVGKLSFATMGGGWTQLEAWGSTTNFLLQQAAVGNLSDDKEYEKSMEKARQILANSPSMMRVFYPTAPTGKDEPGWMKQVEMASEIVAAIVLRKPVATGERLIGDGSAVYARALNSKYVNAMASRSFGLIQAGKIPQAVKVLEPGAGSEQLVVHTRKLIQTGKMSLPEYRNHLAELYAHGATDVLKSGRVSKTLTEGQIQARLVKADRTWHGFSRKFTDLSPSRAETSRRNLARSRMEAREQAAGAAMERRGLGAVTPGHIPTEMEEINRRADQLAGSWLEQYVATGTRPIGGPEQFDSMTVAQAQRLLSIRDEGEVLRNAQIQPEELFGGETRGRLRGGTQVASKGDMREAFTRVEGPTLSSLRTRQSKTPYKLGRARRQGSDAVHDAFSHLIDKAQVAMRGSERFPGSGNRVADFFGAMRSEFGHAAPLGETRGLHEANLPERIRQYVIKYNLGTAEEADAITAKFIHARANNNVRGMVGVQDNLRKRFYAKHGGPGAQFENDPFLAGISTELPSRFRFAGRSGDEEAFRVKSGLDALEEGAGTAHQKLRRLSTLHRHLILGLPGTGEVLTYKHLLADTGRRLVGGGFRFLDADAKRFEPELEALLHSDNRLLRAYGTFMARTREGEGRYMGASRTQPMTFSTRDLWQHPITGAKVKLASLGVGKFEKAAGAFLRRHVTDDAFYAAINSTRDNLDPLVKWTMGTREGRALFGSAQTAHMNEIKRLQAEAKAKGMSIGDAIPPLTEEEFAAGMLGRFNEIGDALGAKGLTWDDAREVVLHAQGKDSKIGKWIRQTRIEFEVKDGLVEKTPSIGDDVMVAWIGQIMRPNKWNRGTMADNVFRMQYGKLRTSGMMPGTAARIAMDVAEKQTVFHMLDFQNMLQIEKDFRYFSYFATKHRLFWKWIISTMTHTPGAVIAVNEARKHLTDKGNLDLHVKVWGQDWQVPMARMFWMQRSEYSQWSPPVLAAYGAVSPSKSVMGETGGLLGNIFTRSDQAIKLAANVAAMQAGASPKNYHSLVAGLGPVQRRNAARFINEYEMSFEKVHGHPLGSEEEAVEWAKWRLVGLEFQRSNLFLPVVPSDAPAGTGPHAEKMYRQLRTWGTLVDVRKAAEYLDRHPDLRDLLGMSEDPKIRLHDVKFWSAYNKLSSTYHAARDHIFEEMQTHGVNAAVLAERDKVDKAFEDGWNAMLVRDALESGVKLRVGKNGLPVVPDGKPGAEFGFWGKKAQSDPSLDPTLGDPAVWLHKRYPSVSVKQFAAATGGYDLKRDRDVLKWLDSPHAQALFATQDDGPESMKQLKRVLLTGLDAYKNIPSDRLGKATDWYIKHVVEPFWKQNELRYQAIVNAPSSDRDPMYAALRQWKDDQDRPVKHNGVEWPSPVRMAWMRLPPSVRAERLAKYAQADPAHLASYELDFLGHPVSKETQRGWDWFGQVKRGYLDVYSSMAPEAKTALARLVDRGDEIIIDKEHTYKVPPHPGFAKVYGFATLTKAERMPQYGYVRDSTHWDSDGGTPEDDFGTKLGGDGHPNWKNLLKHAEWYAIGLKKSGYGQGDISKYWRTTVGDGSPGTLLHWVKSDPGFYREVKMYGPDILHTLVSPGGG